MNSAPALICHDDAPRREQVRKAALNGFDYLEVGCDHTELRVFFLGKAPDRDIVAAQLRVYGGRRIRDIRVLRVQSERSEREDIDDCMLVVVDRPGDFSTYTLCIVDLDPNGRPTDQPPPDFDPRYACVCFSFMASCPSDLDCATPSSCGQLVPPEPQIDYLARDYASLRRLMLDRLALVMPDWKERHVPDLGITLVELLAYVGDQLSYCQDAVATEAYLDTCRQRISVRRHVRLVDYRLHEGCNARAWVCLTVSQQQLRIEAGDIYFVGGDPAAESLVFEPAQAASGSAIELYQDHNEIGFYTWGESECCLPKGATSATLVDPGVEQHSLQLKACDMLVVVEAKGPRTGNPADADPSHRHALRLTRATRTQDPLTGRRLVEIEWCKEDALPFPLCLSSIRQAPDCRPLADVSIACGNVLLVDHGRTVHDGIGQVPMVKVALCEDRCTPAETRRTPGRFRPMLPRLNVTHSQAPIPCVPSAQADCGGCAAAATAALVQEPRLALPQVTLDSYPAAPDGRPAFGPGDIADPSALAQAIAQTGHDASTPAAWLRTQLDPDDAAALDHWAGDLAHPPLPSPLRTRLLALLRSWVPTWQPRADLLASGPDDRHFVVEVDDERRAWLRFGDGDCGRRPDAGTSFHARYRIGNGPVGNLGAGRLTRIVFRDAAPSGVDIALRNPLPAGGGLAPERVDEAKLRAPHLLHQRLERAITAADYATIVQRDFASRVQRAAAVLRWDGSGPEVQVAVDALGSADADDALLGCIERHLQRYRRVGHALRVVAARRVPLLLEITVCVKDGYLRGHIKAALLDALVRRRGLFHPDRLSFGEGVSLSRIAAAAQAVAGVDSMQVTRLERLGDGPHDELANGVLAIGAMEVAQLDNDANFPEHGQLLLMLRGGR